MKALSFDVEAQPGQENGYVAFMYRQSIVVMILLAFSGSLLVGHDFRFRSLPFYLSRRIDRRHYIVGKLLAVSTLIAMLTILPALLLFIEYGMFTGSLDYWTRNWQIPISVLGYGAVTCARDEHRHCDAFCLFAADGADRHHLGQPVRAAFDGWRNCSTTARSIGT